MTTDSEDRANDATPVMQGYDVGKTAPDKRRPDANADSCLQKGTRGVIVWIMKHGATQRTIVWALLVYFALFVIPPVSSFAVTGRSFAAPDVRLSMEQDHRQAKLYLVDIFIWLKLKQSRQPDTTSIQAEAQAVGALTVASTAIWPALLPQQLVQPIRFSGALSRAISGHLSRTSDIYFARSGIAPPFLA